MKKYITLILVLIVWIQVYLIKFYVTRQKENFKGQVREKMIIEKIENLDEISGTSLIRTFEYKSNEQSIANKVSVEEMMLNIGRVFNCLGEPNYISINSENWFEYDLRCDGITLTVYGSSLEIHIGGMQDEASQQKADELVEYIKTFEPKDIYYEAYYLDFDSKEIFEIKNGKPLYRYEQLNLTKEEFINLYNKAYNLDD